MSGAWTPGPWFVRLAPTKVSVYGSNGRKVNGSTCWDSSPYRPTAEADARLIAAAPELYTALGICVAMAERQLKASMNLNDDSPYDIAMKALAKASGK